MMKTTRPAGQSTRGKTARNRLRRVDEFALAYAPDVLKRRGGDWEDAYFVDLGYGAEPFTTLESAARFRRLVPDLRVLGVEIDPERVQRAKPFEDESTLFRRGGFNLPLEKGEHVRLVRAFNVLRQYEESAVLEAWDMICASLLPGGLLIDGTSDPSGRVWTANLVRRPEEGDVPWQVEAIVFGTNFRSGFDLRLFQAVLPKSMIHRVVSGEPVGEFFDAWQRAAQETGPLRVWGPKQWFRASAERLAEMGFDVRCRPRWLRAGWLVWDQCNKPDLPKPAP